MEHGASGSWIEGEFRSMRRHHSSSHHLFTHERIAFGGDKAAECDRADTVRQSSYGATAEPGVPNHLRDQIFGGTLIAAIPADIHSASSGGKGLWIYRRKSMRATVVAVLAWRGGSACRSQRAYGGREGVLVFWSIPAILLYPYSFASLLCS